MILPYMGNSHSMHTAACTLTEEADDSTTLTDKKTVLDSEGRQNQDYVPNTNSTRATMGLNTTHTYAYLVYMAVYRIP